MKKTKLIAALLIAVLGFGTAVLPCGILDSSIAVSAETTLSAPKNIKAVCGNGELIVSWDKVSEASAYRISVKKPGGKDFKTLKTVYDNFVKIPDLSDGEKISVRITPLRKTDSGFKAGSSVKFTKSFKGKKAYLYDNLFVFDTSLFGKTSAQVSKALGKKIKLNDWEWWTDVDGGKLQIAFVSITKDVNMALLFDSDKTLIQAYVDLPVDEYNSTLKATAKKFYGTSRSIMNNVDKAEKESGRILFYDRYFITSDNSIYLDMRSEIYSENEGDIMLRQEYFISDRFIED